MVDYSDKLLGKQDPKHDSRVPMLMALVMGGAEALPPAPPSQDWYSSVAEWPMDANDQAADCTSAAAAHAIQQWTLYAQNMSVIMKTDKVMAFYGATKVPDGEGAYILDVLKYWMVNGVDTGYGSHKITGFAAVDPQNVEHMKCGIAWFGNLMAGFALPKSAQTQDVWSVVPGAASGAGSWGGHCVLITGYDQTYIYFVSWGQVMKMTYAFFKTYCDEIYVMLTRDFMKPPGVTPAGIAWADLANRMKAIKADA